MKADLALRASDFQFVNVARKEGAPVYGKAYLDLDATARGPARRLVVRGSLGAAGRARTSARSCGRRWT